MEENIREVTTEATLKKKTKLRKELNLFDIIFYTVTAIVGLDALGVISSYGGQVLTWLLISAVIFFLPYGLLTAELGSTFTQEGGPYEWCKLAYGRFFGALGAMFYWIATPLWMGGTLSVTAIAAIKTFWFGSPNYQFGGNNITDALIEILIALVFIWSMAWCTIMSLHFGKQVSRLGAYVKLILFIVLTALAVLFAFSGHSTSQHLSFTDLAPHDVGLIMSGILPLLTFIWVGFELQNSAGEEMYSPRRDVPRSLIRAGIISVIAYAIPIAIILFALPKDQLSNVGGFLQTFQSVVGVLPHPVAVSFGWVIALSVVFALASSGATWIIGSDRTYAIAMLDRTGPVLLGRFSKKYGTPITVNILTGITATVAMTTSILITASSSGKIETLFALVLGFTISTGLLCYLFIFPAYLILRYKHPHIPRPYTVPGGMVGAWIVTLLSTGGCALAVYFILIPTDAVIIGNNVDRLTYELTQFTPLGIMILLTVMFYVWGQREPENKDVEITLNLSVKDADIRE